MRLRRATAAATGGLRAGAYRLPGRPDGRPGNPGGDHPPMPCIFAPLRVPAPGQWAFTNLNLRLLLGGLDDLGDHGAQFETARGQNLLDAVRGSGVIAHPLSGLCETEVLTDFFFA